MNRQLPKGWEEEISVEPYINQQLNVRVGQISLSGIFAPRELGDISEEEDGPDQELNQTVNIRKLDDTVFEGQYFEGLPHGFFRHINSYGDLEFFGCFCRGTLVGVCWRSLPGGGFLISRAWDFTEENLIYLYPD